MVESMKSSLATLLVILFMSAGAFAAGKGPEIGLVDNKLSINAETIPLGRLLRLLDLATGMQSKVPAELAYSNHPLSRHHSDQSQIHAPGNLCPKWSLHLHQRSRIRFFPVSR